MTSTLFGTALPSQELVSQVSDLFSKRPTDDDKAVSTLSTPVPIAVVVPSASQEEDDESDTMSTHSENEQEQDSSSSDKKLDASSSLTRRQKKQLLIEKNSRTIFIGNVTTQVSSDKKLLAEFKSLLKQFGDIESMRFRSIAFDAKLPRKVAFIQKKFHTGRETCNVYVVYALKSSVEPAVKALNGSVFQDRHLRVDFVEKNQQMGKLTEKDEDASTSTGGTPSNSSTDPKKCVFLGNLPFDIQDEDLWKTFSVCGEIVHVRVIRDRKTNVGKGFGYVQFSDRSSVGLALKLAGTEISKRQIRVTRCTTVPGESVFKKNKDSTSLSSSDTTTTNKKSNKKSISPATMSALKKKISTNPKKKSFEGARASRSEKPVLKKTSKKSSSSSGGKGGVSKKKSKSGPRGLKKKKREQQKK